MTEQMKGTMYYLYANMRNSLMIFWTIILCILIVTSAIYFVMSTITLSIQISFSTYVYCAIMGSLMVKLTIPYAIKFGSTRKNLFMSIGIFFLLFSLLNSLIANVLNKMIAVFYGTEVSKGIIDIFTTANEKSFMFFHFTQFFENDSWIMMVLVDAIIIFFLMVISYSINLVFYKYGLIGGFGFLGVIMLAMILFIANGMLVDFGTYIFENFTVVLFYQLFGIGLIIYMATFILIRRITI